MKKLHSFIKHLVAILLGTALVGMSVYAVQIPTSLNNALQYIMETIWTSDGTASGTTNVQIWTGGIYIATGFLQDGTGWNSKALGLDNSGNVVYVDANAISNPLLFPTANYIPKINSTQDGLDVSTMYQIGGLIGVNTQIPVKSFDVLGDFQVTTQGSSVTYQYNFFQTSSASTLLSILQTQQCSCDTTNTGVECSAPFGATALDLLFCVDITSQDTGNVNNYFYDIYQKQQIGIAEPVLVTSGTNVGVRTTNPQAALDVSGNVMIHTTPAGSNAWDVLTINPTTKEVSTRSAGSFAGTPGWALVGNGGTNPTTNFLGTTDAQDFVIRTNNIERMRVKNPSGAGLVGIGTNNPRETLDVAGTIRVDSTNGQSNNTGAFVMYGLLGGSHKMLLQAKENAVFTDIIMAPYGGEVGIGNDNPVNSRLHVTGGPVLFDTPIGSSPGGTPVSGAGKRFMWLPHNGSVRAGEVNGSAWDNANIGLLSVGFGYNSLAAAPYSTVGGGTDNSINSVAQNSTIGGGQDNTINLSAQDSATIAGGKENTVSAGYATIGGGWLNTVAGVSSFIGGGYQNTNSGTDSVIGGGNNNRVAGSYNGILGGRENRLSLNGGFNVTQSSIVGGYNNAISGSSSSFIGGGESNFINAVTFLPGGGSSSIVGGYQNSITSVLSAIVGGEANTISSAQYGFIGGGTNNIVSSQGNYGTIPGGENNVVSASHSFAAGQNAIASGSNSFVWSDGDNTQNSNIFDNEFKINSQNTLIGRRDPSNTWAFNAYILGGWEVGLLGDTVADTIWSDYILALNFVSLNPAIPSDSRLKTNIVNGTSWTGGAINLVKALSPVTYQWDDNALTSNLGFDYDAIHYGFIAQDVESILPDMVSDNDQLTELVGGVAGGPIKTLNMNEIIPILTQAIKEQQAIIEDLQARVLDLETP